MNYLTSISINQPLSASASISLNQHQLASISISINHDQHPYELTSINKDKSASIRLNQHQSAFPFSTSFLQVLLVPGQSGGNGPSATPPGSMARSSGLANASMLPRLMPAMAIQVKRLLAQVAYSKLNSFFCGHHVIHLFLNLTVQ